MTQDFLDQVRARTQLSELVGKHVKLKRRGPEFHGLCPFHQEKTPSFTVVDRKGFYHCFGCGAHGDAFRWLMEQEGLTFQQAVAQLAQAAGLTVPKRSRQHQERESVVATIEQTLTLAAKFYQQELNNHPKALAYLQEQRGLTQETIAHFALGYAPDAREPLTAAINSHGLPTANLQAAGLIRADPEHPEKTWLHFKERIMFPVTNHRGKVVGFGGRSLLAQHTAKYINSPTTAAFQKGELLYNFSRALAALKSENNRLGKQMLVVEGYLDVASCDQAGLRSCVAPLGTALTESQLTLLWRACQTPIVCFDGDQAGQKAALRCVERALPLLNAARDLRIVILPDGLDPDALIRTQSAEALLALCQQAMRYEIFLLQSVLARHAEQHRPQTRAAIRQELFDTTQLIRDRTLREEMAAYFRQATQNTAHQNRDRQMGSGQQVAPPDLARREVSSRRWGITGRRTLPIYTPSDPYRRHAFILLSVACFPSLLDCYSEQICRLDLPPGLTQTCDHLLDSLPEALANPLRSDHIPLDRSQLVTHVRRLWGESIGHWFESSCKLLLERVRNLNAEADTLHYTELEPELLSILDVLAVFEVHHGK